MLSCASVQSHLEPRYFIIKRRQHRHLRRLAVMFTTLITLSPRAPALKHDPRQPDFARDTGHLYTA